MQSITIRRPAAIASALLLAATLAVAGTSRADGPRCLERTSVPVLSVTYSADPVVFPGQVAEYAAAARGRCAAHTLKGATHHMHGQPELVEKLADLLVDWGKSL